MQNNFLVYRIWYGDQIVYVGRTKQPLQDRIRGHLFHKPFHKPLEYEKITKIEFAVLPTEADMNLYEIYYILLWHPVLNIDDKAPDNLTVTLPDLEWTFWVCHLWGKWETELTLAKVRQGKEATAQKKRTERIAAVTSELSALKRSYFREKTISEEQFEKERIRLEEEKEKLKGGFSGER